MCKQKTLRSLIGICKASEKQLLASIARHFGEDAIVTDDYIFRFGSCPVLVVAHLDTVHKRPPNSSEICVGPRFLTAPGVGIGGDDRCGVYAALALVKKLDVNVLFTTGEESGGKGAKAFARDVKKDDWDLTDILFAVEIDRRGSRDAVFYDLDSKEFEEFVLKDKFFTKEVGSYTDICEVCPAIGVAGVNLSSGYHNPHMESEYIDIPQLHKAIEHAAMLIRRGAKDGKRYEWKEKPPSSSYLFHDYGGYDDDYGGYDYSNHGYSGPYGWHEKSPGHYTYRPRNGASYGHDDDFRTVPVCAMCYAPVTENDYDDRFHDFLCDDCYEKRMDSAAWCDNCGDLIEDEKDIRYYGENVLCEDCYRDFVEEDEAEEAEEAKEKDAEEAAPQK